MGIMKKLKAWWRSIIVRRDLGRMYAYRDYKTALCSDFWNANAGSYGDRDKEGADATRAKMNDAIAAESSVRKNGCLTSEGEVHLAKRLGLVHPARIALCLLGIHGFSSWKKGSHRLERYCHGCGCHQYISN